MTIIESTALLGELSQAAASSYASAHDAIEASVRLIGEHLGLRTGFVNKVDCAAHQSRIVAAYNAPGGSDVMAGDVLDLPDTL